MSFQKIAEAWIIPSGQIDKSDHLYIIHLAISEDRKEWRACKDSVLSGMGYVKGIRMYFDCDVDIKHANEYFELIRQHLITVLIPALSVSEPVEVNELDRFADLE